MISRKTEFWKSSTPDKLGPGCYTISVDEKTKQNKTAFLVKANRALSVPKRSTASTPGPGSYVHTDCWLQLKPQETSTFASRSKREIFQASRFTAQTPGPGSYETETLSQSPSRKKPKFLAMYLDPSPISIPSRDPNPILSEPSMPTKKQGGGTAFSKYKANRKVFEVTSHNPGPGAYDANDSLDKSISQVTWMFSSKSSRPNSQNGQMPGPGAYATSSKISANAGIFSTAPRELPLTNDPYRPIQVGCHDVPAVGSYKSKEDQNKEEKLKAKFITGDIYSKVVPFNTNEKRQMPWVPKDKIPGPGDYIIEKGNNKKDSNLIVKAPRFEREKVPDYPGPGTYDSQIVVNEKPSPIFSSKIPRFTSVPAGHSTPEPYFGHQKWTKKQTRAEDSMIINQKLCFDSSVPRFKKKKASSKLGPGCYDTRPSTVASIPVSRTERFSGYGNYRPSTGTDQHIGPGYYNPSVTNKKSFNMAKELNNEKLWIM